MIDLGVAEGQHMTLALLAAADSQRCSLGVVQKLEEVNNIAAAAAAGPLSPVFLGGKATHGVRPGTGRVRFKQSDRSRSR